jgi:hypothetical protein
MNEYELYVPEGEKHVLQSKNKKKKKNVHKVNRGRRKKEDIFERTMRI